MDKLFVTLEQYVLLHTQQISPYNSNSSNIRFHVNKSIIFSKNSSIFKNFNDNDIL